jgi:hypothetical protein
LMSQRVFRWMYRIFFTDNFKKKTNNSFVIMCKGKYCRRKKVHFLENLKINWVKKQYPIWSFSVSEKLQSELSTDIESLCGKAYTLKPHFHWNGRSTFSNYYYYFLFLNCWSSSALF